MHLCAAHLALLEEHEVGLDPATRPAVLEGIQDLFMLGDLLIPNCLHRKPSRIGPRGPRRCCSSVALGAVPDLCPSERGHTLMSGTLPHTEPRLGLPTSQRVRRECFQGARGAHGVGVREEKAALGTGTPRNHFVTEPHKLAMPHPFLITGSSVCVSWSV